MGAWGAHGWGGETSKKMSQWMVGLRHESARKAGKCHVRQAEDSISKGTKVRKARLCARKPQAALDSETRVKQAMEEKGPEGLAGAGCELFTFSFI